MTLCTMKRRLLALGAGLLLAGSLAAPLNAVAAGGSYTVSEGDTLSHIALEYGTTVDDLAALNGISDPDLIVTGMVLSIPAWDSSADTAWSNASDDSWSSSADDSWSAEGDTGTDQDWVAVDDDVVWVDPPYVPQETVVALLMDAANMYGWDPSLILAQAWQESRWRQDGISHAGAIGVMQVLPSTAADVGTWYLGREVDPVNSVWDNIESGVAFLTILYWETGDVDTALAAYYQGLGSLERDGWFPDTVEYVELIRGFQEMIENGDF